MNKRKISAAAATLLLAAGLSPVIVAQLEKDADTEAQVRDPATYRTEQVAVVVRPQHTDAAGKRLAHVLCATSSEDGGPDSAWQECYDATSANAFTCRICDANDVPVACFARFSATLAQKTAIRALVDTAPAGTAWLLDSARDRQKIKELAVARGLKFCPLDDGGPDE